MAQHVLCQKSFYPEINIADVILNRKKFGELPLLTTKSKHWCYEKEWRCLHPHGNIAFGSNITALTGMYFGCEMPYVHKEIIFLILKGSPTKAFTKCNGLKQNLKLTSVYTEYTPYDCTKKPS